LKTICFVSSNSGKILEIGKILKEHGIEMVAKEFDIPEDKTKPQEEIAKEKAKAAAEIIGSAVIAEDTGLYFEACNNFPGINSRDVFDELGFEGLLKKLEGKSRRAYFKSVVAYCEPNSKPIIFVGVCKGVITEEPIGETVHRLPYDNIFVPDGDSRAFSEMTKEEKAKYSHRAKAVRAFAECFFSKK
jgi:XTP/dITP diphosphohydrolase